MNSDRGYREIAHTADWELEAWAPDLAGLLEQAAMGMVTFCGAVLSANTRQVETLEIRGEDPESLLVGFLTELLYIQENRGWGFENVSVRISGEILNARLVLRDLVTIQKEIKAVTWHKLKIEVHEGVWKVRIVFDV